VVFKAAGWEAPPDGANRAARGGTDLNRPNCPPTACPPCASRRGAIAVPCLRRGCGPCWTGLGKPRHVFPLRNEAAAQIFSDKAQQAPAPP
jgi:hypothetical protein